MNPILSAFQFLLLDDNRLRVGWRVVLFLSALVLASGVSFLPLVAVVLASWLMVWIDRRPFSSLGVAAAGMPRQFALGGALGVGMLGVVVGLILWLTPSQARWAAPADVAPFWLAFLPLWYFSVAAFEELLVRGYLLQTLAESLGAPVALLATSAGFALIHLGNDHLGPLALLNLFLAGALLGILVLRTQSLWAAIGFHFTWNAAMGNGFGLPVSGIDVRGYFGAVYGVTQADLATLPQAWDVTLTGPEWLSGGAFGPEASALTSVALLAGCAWAWRAGGLHPVPAAARLWARHVPLRGAPQDAPKEPA